MAYEVYPINRGPFRIEADNFELLSDADELFFEQDGEYVAFFPLHQIIGFVQVP